MNKMSTHWPGRKPCSALTVKQQAGRRDDADQLSFRLYPGPTKMMRAADAPLPAMLGLSGRVTAAYVIAQKPPPQISTFKFCALNGEPPAKVMRDAAISRILMQACLLYDTQYRHLNRPPRDFCHDARIIQVIESAEDARRIARRRLRPMRCRSPDAPLSGLAAMKRSFPARPMR